jgi:acyl-coenzyme A thioesterase PaaI-like protein
MASRSGLGPACGEPVRGIFPNPGDSAAPGAERVQALIGSGTLPPLCHLVGLRVSQVETGGVTVSLPASPWLVNAVDVHVSLDLLSAVTCELAGLTAVAAGDRARLVVLNTEPMRMARGSDGPFAAVGTVVHAGRTFIRVAATVRDGVGRLVGHAIGTLALAPSDSEKQHPKTRAAPVHYETPDPSQRPAPADNITSRHWEHAEPLEVFRGIMTGELPNPALNRLLGIQFLDLAPGSSTLSIPASRWFALQDGAVSPAILNTVSAIASGGSAMNWATDDRIAGEINRTIAFERPIPADDRTVLPRANTKLQGCQPHGLRGRGQ